MTVRCLTRQSFSILSVLIVAILLSGCIEIRLESEFHEDGSARHSLQSTIEREGLEQLNSMGGEGEIDTFDPEDGREEAEAAGFEYTAIDSDELVGSRLAKTFDDGEQVGSAFDEMFSAAADEDSAATVGAVTGTFVKDGNTYRLNLTIDSDILFENAGGTDDAEDGEDLPIDSMESFFDISYTASMPGKITETNGTDLGDGKVEWKLPLTGVTEISAVSEVEGGSGIAALAIAGLVGLLVVGGLVGAMFFMRQKAPTPEAVDGGVAFTPPPPSGPESGADAGAAAPPPSSAPPSHSMGINAPPLARADDPATQPPPEQDTTKLP